MNYEDPFADNIGLVFLQYGGEFLLDIENINVIHLPIDYVDQDFVGFPTNAAGNIIKLNLNFFKKKCDF